MANGSNGKKLIFKGPYSKIRLYSLVLSARNIPHKIEKDGKAWAILVNEDDEERAIQEIELFIEENRHFQTSSKRAKNTRSFVHFKQSLYSICIISCIMSLTFRYEVRKYLLDNFAADSTMIIKGQWWRAFTALFLHSDPAHFLSNVFLGAIFFIVLFEETGVLMGWLLVFSGGTLGNYINAISHGYGHVSIGLSTAIFSALGSYCAIRIVRGKIKGKKEAVQIFLSGMALLAMLGSGNDNGKVDISAHFFGFLAGFGLGIFWGAFQGFIKSRNR